MVSTVLLQGGAEFGPSCREMDSALLARVGAVPVVVVALAAEPGRDYASASAHAVDYYSSLGAADVVAAPDARTDPEGAVAAVRRSGLVVLPGGSPNRLLTGLRGTAVGDAVRDVLAAGGAVSGASAGAMVLCAWTVLPEQGRPELVEGLGVVPRSLALPHFSGDVRWLDAVSDRLPADVTVLGLAECAGVLAVGPDYARVTAVGAEPTRLLGARDQQLAVGSSLTM